MPCRCAAATPAQTGRLDDRAERMVRRDGRQAPLLGEDVVERAPLDELHDEVGRRALEDAVVGDADGVGVADGGRGHRLLPEARGERGVVADEVGEDDLDGVLRLDELVVRLEDEPHAALPELAFEQVALVERGVEVDEKLQAVTVARTVIDLVCEAAMAGRTLFHSGGSRDTRS